MADQYIRAGDVGVPISMTIGGSSDLVGATASIKFQLPNSTTISRTATMSGRTLTYNTTADDFTTAGKVIAQGKVTLANGQSRSTGRGEFQVEGTL